MKFNARSFPNFTKDWKTFKLENWQNISGSEFMKLQGFKSARYLYRESVWELTEQEYLLFLLRYGA